MLDITLTRKLVNLTGGIKMLCRCTQSFGMHRGLVLILIEILPS